MNILKVVRNTAIVAAFVVATAMLSGCGGVSEAQMQQLNDLRGEVNSLQTKADSLKDERSNLEKELAEKNAKLQQCEKDKQETQANLQKMGQ
jgi:septal ring factor EnvC (AmiA/AmiB activator)